MKVFIIIFIVNSVCAFTKLSVNKVDKIQQRLEPIKNHRFFLTNSTDSNLLKTGKSKRNVFYKKQQYYETHKIESQEKQSRNETRPRFTLSRTSSISFQPEQYICIEKYSLECKNKTEIFRDKVLSELKKVSSENVEEPNFYKVSYIKKFENLSSECLVFNAGLRTLRKKDVSFVDLEKFIPKRKLFRKKDNIRSCVVISSAGSLIGSQLGKFIDLHDVVLRFNHAPTEGYESDVGSKTTIRILNSQVVSKSKFDFLNSEMYQNISLAAWDPGKFNQSLSKWLQTPDFDLFTNYKLFIKKNPKANLHLIDPRSIWRLWEALQEFSGYKIRTNPPSSGFLGIALLLPVCEYVDVVEYIPSTRLNGRCHYFSEEINTSCTFGVWHPLGAEKLMAYDMNLSKDFIVFQNGVLRIRRPEENACISDYDV